MVTRYGFSEKLGPVVYGQDEGEVFLGRDFGQSRNYSESVAAEIDSEIRELIDTAYERTKDILSEHMEDLHRVADYLFVHEKIDAQEFQDLMEGKILETSAQDLPGDLPEDSQEDAQAHSSSLLEDLDVQIFPDSQEDGSSKDPNEE